ncbi:MAG: hypothetical protein QM488_12795 [Rhizobiaceae bacterium]
MALHVALCMMQRYTLEAATVSKFATDKEYISEAYYYVMSGTRISADLHEKLLPAFVQAHQSGDPKKELHALKPLNTAEWQWPMFDLWSKAFQQINIWPYMWDKFDIPDLLADQQSEECKRALVKLLCHNLSMTTYTCHKALKGSQKDWFSRHGWRLVSINDPVEDKIAEDLKDQVLLDDWRTWPPFFPGDRTSMTGNRFKATNPRI